MGNDSGLDPPILREPENAPAASIWLDSGARSRPFERYHGEEETPKTDRARSAWFDRPETLRYKMTAVRFVYALSAFKLRQGFVATLHEQHSFIRRGPVVGIFGE